MVKYIIGPVDHGALSQSGKHFIEGRSLGNLVVFSPFPPFVDYRRLQGRKTQLGLKVTTIGDKKKLEGSVGDGGLCNTS